MKDNELLIAFDVGGTKTDAVLITTDGHIVQRVLSEGANPLDIGFEEACARYQSALATLSARAPGGIHAIYGGIACVEYFGDRVRDYLSPRVPCASLRIEGDGPCLISAMLGHSDGACLICGTGSSLYVRKGDIYDHIGGWGYLIDSCASGFILGKKAVLAAIRAHDGRGEATALTQLLAERCGEPVHLHLETLYKRGRPYFASLAGAVFAGAKLGDAVSLAIFNGCVDDLAEMARAAAARFDGAFDLVLNGGVFQHYPEYAHAFAQRAPRQARIIHSDAPPVFGGAVEAMHDAGLPVGADFKRNFMADYDAGSNS